MVRHLIFILLTCCLSTNALAQTQFNVNFLSDTPHTTIELGKPLWLEISSNLTTPSLDSIDLTELSTQFHIDTSAPINTDTEHGRQNWRLVLYAYNTGAHTIPPLLYAQMRSTPLNIEITDALDPKTRSPIKIQVQLSHTKNQTVWVREQILLRYTLTTNNIYSQFKVPHYSQPGVEIRAFKLDSQPHSPQQFDFTLGWTMHALRSGQLQLSLPPLQLVSDGVPTHHFYPLPLKLAIKALPVYVPATMPVGQLHVLVPNHWQFTLNQTLAQFPLIMSGNGIASNQLPALANELQSTASLRTYPTQAQSTNSFNANGIMSKVSYQVPYKPIAQGLLSLPPIRFSYFDPHSATVKTLFVDSVLILSVNRWLVLLLAIISLYLIYRVGVVLFNLLRHKTQQAICYYHALQLLTTVDSAEELRHCMALVAQAEAWPENLSINQWIQRMETGPSQHTQQLVEKLNLYCYQVRAQFDTNHLKRELRELCIQRHPLLKLFG